VLTERVKQIIDSGPQVAYLSEIAEVSGRTLIGAEVARQYGITDRDGRQPPSFRELMNVEPFHYKGRPEQPSTLAQAP
jgi:hypothetical protein